MTKDSRRRQVLKAPMKAISKVLRRSKDTEKSSQDEKSDSGDLWVAEVEATASNRHLSDPKEWECSGSSEQEETEEERKRNGSVCDQASSPLFRRFPIEIREMIWTYFLCSQERIDLGVVKKDDLEYGRLQLKAKECDNPEDACPVHTCMQSETSKSHLNFLPLLLSCKLIYIEAIPFLYSQNHFSFTDKPSFHLFTTLVSPVYLSKITSLTLNTCYAYQPPNTPSLHPYLPHRSPKDETLIAKFTSLKYISTIDDNISDDWNDICRMVDDSPDFLEVSGSRMSDWGSVEKNLPGYCKPVRDLLPAGCRMVVYVDSGARPPFEVWEMLEGDGGVKRLGDRVVE